MTDKLLNFALAQNFRFFCSELPFTSTLIQDVTLPSITIGQVEVYNRHVDYKLPGEKLIFTELDIGFVMDENYDAYTEIFSWMSKMSGPSGMSAVKVTDREVLVADAEVTILDNTGRLIRKITFTDAWPTAIGALALDTQGPSTEIKSILTLAYTAMTINPPTKNLTQMAGMSYTGH